MDVFFKFKFKDFYYRCIFFASMLIVACGTSFSLSLLISFPVTLHTPYVLFSIPMDLIKKVSQKLDLPKGSSEHDLESRGIKTKLNYMPLISEEGSILFAALMFEGKKHNLYIVYSDSPRNNTRKEWGYITKKDSNVVIESYHNDFGNIKRRQLEVLEKYFDLCPEFVNDKKKRIGYSNLECN